MILQALNDYYQRRQRSSNPQDRLPAFGLEEKEISFVIEIDAKGRLVNLADTRTIEGKKKIGQRFLVPQGIKKTSGVAANLLWDTAEYVLGVDTKGKPERVVEQHAAFRARLEALPEDALRDAGIQAILAFLKNIDLKQLETLPAWPDILTTNPVMTFRLHGDVELVCQRPAIVDTTAQTIEEKPDGICLVSGIPMAIERLHPSIKGVWGAQTSGANIVSFNLDAFNSYGKSRGANAPLGKPATFAYTTALNHLLARDSRQRIQVGDASTVFWAEQANDLETALPDLFGEPPKDDPNRGTDALKVLYRAVQTGKFTNGSATDRFHVLGLSPNAARIAIRFWETASALNLAKRIACHFDDINIARAPHDPEHLSLFRLLTSLAVQGKADNIPPNLGGEVMRAILEDLPYPATLLNQAVQRNRAEQKPNYARAAIIKASLNRLIRRTHNEKEFMVMLDPTNTHPAYLLGRLFATLEKIQEEASPGLNATIRDRYYGAASSTPVAVFTTLLRLHNHHLGKLSKGRGVQMERLVGEIMGGLDDFPRILALPDQGRFALGYYHQRQAFFTKSDTPTTNNPEESK
ncbi:type I-C CRISPR-associated protein Cas8c/Csd1 [Halothiobacillus neapolitanus]|uniref:CRISPR-associated protein, Csd1 family n=1 Tax=Halothiobacillus neapolitanus (strain ATCC 23641 / DSM 15147 / CIP 104769 / NCIMB 8539 / c2) TaxID=555778 RepID=D0KYZ7_HALNC|nr:type I-C CRISPR-associated protein Cas8c/Csd1 [Halothiobacillus neapolitanus]ACX95670.1 CRISPR-associated protein, Csd1 family [Halothiobacillus neapolitanus c2]TDN65975.1 CRISPR-associated Csd1 family protein [Halothiobacillus neapolitanus]